MKIGGPKGPGAVPEPPEPTKKAEGERGPSFDEVLDPAAAARSSGPASAIPSGLDIDEVVAAVEAGAMSPEGALQTLVDRLVERHAATLGPALRSQLQQTLLEVLEQDPLLASKLSRLRALAKDQDD